jgi:hypothetical protein
MVWRVYPCNQATREQQEGRIARIGQTTKTIYYITVVDGEGFYAQMLKRHEFPKQYNDILKFALDDNPITAITLLGGGGPQSAVSSSTTTSVSSASSSSSSSSALNKEDEDGDSAIDATGYSVQSQDTKPPSSDSSDDDEEVAKKVVHHVEDDSSAEDVDDNDFEVAPKHKKHKSK